jgi:Transglutaminase-like superfamily
MSSAVTQQYYLAPGVHTCCTGEFCVFLDLKRDQYISVNTGSLCEVARFIDGLNISGRSSASASERFAPQSAGLLDALCSAQLITGTHSHKPSRTASIPHPGADLTSVGAPDASPNGAAHLLHLAKAFCGAHLELSRRPLARVIAKVEHRKLQRHVGYNENDLRRTLVLAHHFSKFRFLYPKNYLCLFDSLALLFYLARYNLYPMWVFGVREAPFFAHCWVQAGPIVLSDYRDKVIPYTPIMVI